LCQQWEGECSKGGELVQSATKKLSCRIVRVVEFLEIEVDLSGEAVEASAPPIQSTDYGRVDKKLFPSAWRRNIIRGRRSVARIAVLVAGLTCLRATRICNRIRNEIFVGSDPSILAR